MFEELKNRMIKSDMVGVSKSTQPSLQKGGRGISKRPFEKLAGKLSLSILLAAVFLISCNEEFEKFTDVTDLRVMAIRVEPAELLPGDTGEISALVSAPAGESVTYQWRWCPVPTSALTGHECPIDDAVLLQLIAENAASVSTELSDVAIPDLSIFDLGTGAAAQFPYVIDSALLQLACDQVATQFGDELPITLDCDDRFTTTVRLDVQAGDKTITAVKELNLLLNSEIIPNGNPGIGAIHLVADGGLQPLNAAAEIVLPEKVAQDFLVDIQPSASETFLNESIETGEMENDRENLFMTWFITGGDTEFGRTSFIAGETPFGKLRLNSWYLPTFEESGGNATIYVVLQDERGGIAWASGAAQVKGGE